MNLYDFIDEKGVNVILAWLKTLEKRDRAKVDVKLVALRDMDYELAIGTKLLQGPIHKHIYKLKIHGTVMLRPLLSRGPISNDAEYTLLAGAAEVNFKLIPANAVQVAEVRRSQVIANQRDRRRPHARFY